MQMQAPPRGGEEGFSCLSVLSVLVCFAPLRARTREQVLCVWRLPVLVMDVVTLFKRPTGFVFAFLAMVPLGLASWRLASLVLFPLRLYVATRMSPCRGVAPHRHRRAAFPGGSSIRLSQRTCAWACSMCSRLRPRPWYW